MVETKTAVWIELESITGKHVVFRLPSEEKNWRACLCIESIIMWKYADEHNQQPEHVTIWDGTFPLNQLL